jgi:hypothetical protein
MCLINYDYEDVFLNSALDEGQLHAVADFSQGNECSVAIGLGV